MRMVERVYRKLTTVLGDSVEVWIALMAWPERISKAHGQSPEVIIRIISGFWSPGKTERDNGEERFCHFPLRCTLRDAVVWDEGM